MNIAELKSIISDLPDDMEVRIGNFFDTVAVCETKTVSVNFKKFDCLVMSDEDVD